MSLYNDIESVLISKKEIEDKINELSKLLTADYQNKNPLLICILKGSVIFFADLIRKLNFPLETEFMIISSYGDNSSSSGEVKVIKDTDVSLSGRHVIIVEDIIDSGLTLAHLKKMFKTRNPASLKICALLSKPDRRKTKIDADYQGFLIPDKFVVGYGLDHAQKYRNLNEICILKSAVINTH